MDSPCSRSSTSRTDQRTAREVGFAETSAIHFKLTKSGSSLLAEILDTPRIIKRSPKRGTESCRSTQPAGPELYNQNRSELLDKYIQSRIYESGTCLESPN